MNSQIVCEFLVAGVRFYNWKSADIQPGDTLTLEPEPTNPYDPNAIKVLKGTTQVGHVPRTHTEQVHGIINTGVPYSALVQYADMTGKYPKILAVIAT